MREKIKEYIPLLLALTVLVSTVIAAVFVYYPISATVSPVQPPIVFAAGSNAGSSDLRSGNTIDVAVGGNGTSLSITIHPTYQVSYYRNLAVIKNTDSKAYYVNLIVYTPISWTNGNVTLIVYGSGAVRSLTGWPSTVPTTNIPQSYLGPTTDSYVAILDLTTSSSTSFKINASQTLEVDLLIYIPEGVDLPSSATAQVYLVYSPVSETPPQLV